MPQKKKGRVAGETETGFYEKALNDAEKLNFQFAARVEGVDEEIALLRLKIKELLADENADLRPIIAAADLLCRLVRTRYSITSKQQSNLKDALERVVKDLAIPLGIELFRK
jgi:hypothetical protein